MKIHHLRNATFVIESGAHHILIDPMLSDKGQLPSFTRFKHKPLKNPTVPLPANTADILAEVTHCLITHSQKLGVRALQHTDHLDGPGASFLRERGIPVTTRRNDGSYLKKLGLNIETQLQYWQPQALLGGEIIAIPAQHGHGWVHHLMANGAGFFLRLADAPSIYISGDTVYTADVERALKELKPDIAVMASGSASLDVGGPILMTLKELVAFAQNAPKIVIANHLEALNHCPTTRSQLRQEIEKTGLSSKVFIPKDGETLTFHNSDLE